MDAGLDSLGSVELRNGLAKSVGMELLLAKTPTPRCSSAVFKCTLQSSTASPTHTTRATGVYKYI
jgi:hypothetical protein